MERKHDPTVEGLRNIQRLMKIRNPSLEKLKVEDLIDDRMLRKLDESGFIDNLAKTYPSNRGNVIGSMATAAIYKHFADGIVPER